jgi:hypothetical protein
MMLVSGLLISWVTLDASSPIAAIFVFCTSCSCVSFSSCIGAFRGRAASCFREYHELRRLFDRTGIPLVGYPNDTDEFALESYPSNERVAHVHHMRARESFRQGFCPRVVNDKRLTVLT